MLTSLSWQTSRLRCFKSWRHPLQINFLECLTLKARLFNSSTTLNFPLPSTRYLSWCSTICRKHNTQGKYIEDVLLAWSRETCKSKSSRYPIRIHLILISISHQSVSSTHYEVLYGSPEHEFVHYFADGHNWGLFVCGAGYLSADGLLMLSLKIYRHVLQFGRFREDDIFSRLSGQCLLVAWSLLQSLKLLLLPVPFPQWKHARRL